MPHQEESRDKPPGGPSSSESKPCFAFMACRRLCPNTVRAADVHVGRISPKPVVLAMPTLPALMCEGPPWRSGAD
eukprot:CAMPEP_0197664462 /NCGR_PEP_ID=MMETSP1338-20131121/58648_1 /TAXON_ID=43686 ORGANISM="Pelagodinium beii, Strain RCC1491" /NCGR_SAMPLE_ID=MMETSP1338 /ASSEMBLY_ACC=CAM_ASM_000754 /LENGTH=74 /DNA_ID=CAMNT_0043243101 /DNA_START=445 /DNA_END=669 /DNA_ORIENTATION=-